MSNIERSDLRVIDYAEFGNLLQQLTDKVKAAGAQYDLIVPILRSGAMPAMHLAAKLGVTNILPAQYKYKYGETVENVRKFKLPELEYAIPDAPRILVVDTNTAEGRAARNVIADVRERYPQARIDFATVAMDQALVTSDLAETMYFVILTNECRLMDRQAAQSKGVTNDFIVYPWEDAEDIWTEIQAVT